MYKDLRSAALRVFSILLICALFCSSALASSTAVISGEDAVLRAEASLSADALGELAQGTEVEILGKTGAWTKVSVGELTGFALTTDLTTATTGKRIKAIVTKKAAVYKSASTSSKKLGTVKKGTVVYVVGKKGSFFKVQNASGSRTGYMLKSTLKQATTSSSKSSSVIAIAKKFRGVPYVRNATGPKSFDCSGFTRYCFKKVGVSLSRSAKGQGYNNGRKVSKSQLKAGDIVCFDTDPDDGDKCDHVGIYLGGGKFIHASSAAGKVVISSLSSGYYARVFSWGRRVL